MIKLSEIDPVEVALEVCSWVVEHVRSVTFHIDPSGEATAPLCRDLTNSDLALSVAELARYARSGPPHCDDANGPAEYLQTVAEVLLTGAHPRVYSIVPYPWDESLDEGRDTDPEHAIDVVLVAAMARDRLESGSDVTVRQLAALASLGVATLRTYGSRGEFRVEGGEIAHAEAVRWLSGRGIKIDRRLP